MAYVYRHIRLDTNVPFYIGIGNDRYYRRVESMYSRNPHWHNIVKKTGYLAEVFIDGIPHETAKIKEKEFIKLYGRSDLGLGTLVNYTDGGDGNTNWTDERRLKHIEFHKGKYVSKETRQKLSVALKGRKVRPELLKKMSDTSKRNIITKETREKMASKLRGRPQPQWQRDILSKAAIGKKVYWCYKPIIQYSRDGVFIKEFESISAAKKSLMIANIDKVLSGNRIHAGNFIFRYK